MEPLGYERYWGIRPLDEDPSAVDVVEHEPFFGGWRRCERDHFSEFGGILDSKN